MGIKVLTVACIGVMAVLATPLPLPAQTAPNAAQSPPAITDLLVVPPDLQKQLQLYDELRKRPTAEDHVIVPWLTRHSTELTPVFAYELARRLWDQGRRDDAFEWYNVASIRAGYDGFRCADKTAAQGVMFLPRAATNVAQSIEAHRAAYGLAGLRALARPDLFASRVSPLWICIHGIGVFSDTPNGQQKTWFKPQSEWDEIRTTLVKQMTVHFEEQGKPQDDPIPRAKAIYPQTEIEAGATYNFVWLDSDQLVIGHTIREPQTPTVLKLWRRPGGELQEIARIAGLWCAGDGKLSYRKRSEAGAVPGQPPNSSPGQPKRMTVLIGPPDKMEEYTIEFTGQLRYPQLMQQSGRSFSHSTEPYRQSPFDCRWVKSERLSGPEKGANWMPLRNGDGFVSTDQLDGKPSKNLLYFASETAKPVEMPIPTQGISVDTIRYAGFRKSYFVAAPVDRPKEKETPPSCRPVWWFQPGGKVETQCVATDALDSQGYYYVSSRIGILRISGLRRTPHGEKPGGIYLTTASGSSEKIYEGRIWMINMSPDGCALALRNYPNIPGKEPPVTILDLCNGPTSRR